jgi:hypothetical protein
MILGFGDLSTEFFYNAGNSTGSVLSRIDNATLRIGAIRNTTGRGTAIRSIGNNVYWIGVNADTGARGIYRMNGMQPEKISPPAVDKLISNGVLRSILGSFTLLGMSHIGFGLGTTTCLCYCLETNFWWFFTPGGTLNVSALLSAGDSDSQSNSYFSTVTNAKIYTFDPNSPVWQDNSQAYTMTVQTDNLSVDTRMKKYWRRLDVEYDKQSSTSNLGVSYSDDDYANFSTVRNIDTSTSRNFLTRLGSSKRRSWKFTHSANTPCRVGEIEIDYEFHQTP